MSTEDYREIIETTEDVTDEKYLEIKKSLNKVIHENVKKILKERGLSQREFCKILVQEKTSVTRSQFSKFINNPENMSIAFALSCCDFFGVSLQNLCSTEFDATEYIFNDSKTHKEYLDIKALMDLVEAEDEEVEAENVAEVGKNQVPMNQVSLMDVLAKDLLAHKNTDLVVDPASSQFKGYIQDYYCYYFPTNSSQNKGDDQFIKGVLSLKDEDGFCKAVLKIDTGTIDDAGNTNYKIYVGYTAISTSVNSVTCMMYSEELCEFCFLMFRYFKINFGKQQCRIAEVLSSSSATEDRRPTVLRMFLSREEIKDEDLRMIAPAFSLNYSTVSISKEELQKIAEMSEKHTKVVNELINISTDKEMVFCKEQDIKQIGKRYLDTEMQALQLVMQIRDKSYAYKYNKIGGKADDSVRELLLARGYFE